MNVQQAVASVAARLPAIGKDETSPQGYKYRGIEQIMGLAAGLLAEAGIVITPHVQLVEFRPVTDMPKWMDVVVRVDWTITGPDGDTLTARTLGIGRDNSDKGANKAHTQARKYMLFDLLHIADKRDDAEAAQGADTPVHDVTDEIEQIKALTSAQREMLKRRINFPEGGTLKGLAEMLSTDIAALAVARDFLGHLPTTSPSEEFGGAPPPEPPADTPPPRTKKTKENHEP